MRILAAIGAVYNGVEMVRSLGRHSSTGFFRLKGTHAPGADSFAFMPHKGHTRRKGRVLESRKLWITTSSGRCHSLRVLSRVSTLPAEECRIIDANRRVRADILGYRWIGLSAWPSDAVAWGMLFKLH